MTASNYPLKSSIQKSPKSGDSKKRRVAFSTVHEPKCNDAAPISRRSTDDEVYLSWYTNEELIRMKEESRCNAHFLRIAAEKDGTVKNAKKSQSTAFPLLNEQAKEKMIATYRKLDDMKCAEASYGPISYDLEPRGLEHRIFLERQIYKYFTDKAVLECQRRNKEVIADAASKGYPKIHLLVEAAERRLSNLSQKCTEWSRNLAAATGKSDFEIIYGPSSMKGSNHSLVKDLQRRSLKRNLMDESPLSQSFEQMEPNKRQRKNSFVDLTVANSASQLLHQKILTGPANQIIDIKS